MHPVSGDGSAVRRHVSGSWIARGRWIEMPPIYLSTQPLAHDLEEDPSAFSPRFC